MWNLVNFLVRKFKLRLLLLHLYGHFPKGSHGHKISSIFYLQNKAFFNSKKNELIGFSGKHKNK